MKFLVLLFLVGCASSASLYDALDDAAVEQELSSLDNGLYLKQVLELVDDQLYGDDDNEVIKALKKKLQEMFEKILDNIKEHIANKKEIGDRLKERIKQVIERVKQWKIELGKRIREKLEDLKDKVPDEWKKLIEELLKRKDDSLEGEALSDNNIKDLLKQLKEKVKSLDREKILEWIEEKIGNNWLGDALKKIVEKGDQWKEKLLNLIDRYLGKDEKRSIKEYWEKVKNYFKDLKIDLQEKFMKFGEWVKENVRKGVDKGKDKLDNIKAIAREFIDHAKEVSEDVTSEAREFFRLYKDQLGDLWNKLREVFKNTGNKNE